MLMRALLLSGLLAALPWCPETVQARTQPQAAARNPAPSPVLTAGTDATVLAARDALRRRDGAALLTARDALLARRHPLAQWAAYWELNLRLPQARQADLEAFYQRWPGTYVEDRLRNDWLLELGKRGDWDNFRREFPRFRMNDDRAVTCWWLLTRHQDGHDVGEAARAAWFDQRDLDEACHLMAGTLLAAAVLRPDDAWHKARLALEANRPRAALAAALLAAPQAQASVERALEQPAAWLAQRSGPADAAAALGPAGARQLDLLALMRLAADEPEAAAAQLQGGATLRLGAPGAATAWAHAARQAAIKQQPLAATYARQAWQVWDAQAAAGQQPAWTDELLAWHVRAALREALDERARWPLVSRAIAAMSPQAQRDEAWVYWGARAQLALAPAGRAGDAQRVQAHAALRSVSTQLSFYGKLAAETLGGSQALPPPPQPLTMMERTGARAKPGLGRALQLIALGLRSEGVREWNFTLRGLGERELLAAAQWACEREVWDRCINTSERTRTEVDMTQRFPLPLLEQVSAQARASGLEPSLLYGLIRQESRFVPHARSGAGASGLMQLMPATARWTARREGIPFTPRQINDPELNLRLGAAYLRMLVEDFEGSLAMATAAYNAGPGRPRRWREGEVLEPAAWAESIPFHETRDYVKKVLSNAVYYAAMLGQPMPSLTTQLGPPVGPRDAAAPPANRALP